MRTVIAGWAISPLLLLPAASAQQPVLGDVITPRKQSAMERQIRDVANVTGLPIEEEWQRKPLKRANYISPEQLVMRLQQLEEKLGSIVLPQVEMQDVTIRDAVFQLRELMREHDEFAGGETETVTLVLRFSGDDEALAARKVDLSLKKVTARQAILKVAEAFGLDMEVTPYAVSLRER